MKEIHDKIFTYLRDNYPDLTFVLRKTDRYGRLKQGYWFMGGNANPELNYLCVSFWDIMDDTNKTPKIYIDIQANGKCQLYLVDKDDSKDDKEKERSDFFKEIASALKVNQIIDRRTGEERQVWIKEYEKKDYISIIDDFIKGDKILIDTFIKLNKKERLFPSVSRLDFEKCLKRIAEIQPSLKAKTEMKKWDRIVIQKLKLKNIGHFEDLEIDFQFDDNKRVAIFFGKNGSGKSTILQTIALGIAGKRDRKTINEEDRKNKDNGINENLAKLLRNEKVEDNIRYYSTNSFVELAYNKQYQNKINFNWIEEDDIQVVEDIERSDYQNFEDNNLLCLVKGFSQNKKVDGESDLDKKKVEMNSEKPITADLRPLIYQLADDSFKNFKNWIVDAATNPIYYNKIKPAMSKAFEVIEKITEGAFELIPVSVNEPDISIKTPDAPNGIPIEMISQGYNNVIGWIGDFIKRLYQTTPDEKKSTFWESPAICIIDEIDTYLHPAWQKTILRTLAETFTNTHFIVTTHSPLVIINLPTELVTIYEISKSPNGKFNVSDILEDDNLKAFGLSTTDFLKSSAGMDINDRDDNVDRLLRKFRQEIEKGQIKDAESTEKELKVLTDNVANTEFRRLIVEKEIEKQWQNR